MLPDLPLRFRISARTKIYGAIAEEKLGKEKARARKRKLARVRTSVTTH
jgi:hypothetical protein